MIKAFVTLLLFISSGAFGDTITVRADIWCPYNCDSHSEQPGYIIEAAKLIFKKSGHTIDYKTMNWARTIREVGQGTFDGAVGAAKDEAPKFIYPKNSQGVADTIFITLKKSKWKFSGEESLKNISIGLNAGYAQGDKMNSLLKKFPQSFQFAKGENPVKTNLRKLIAGRVDAIYVDQNVARYLARKMTISNKIKRAGRVEEKTPNADNLYIAFSPNNTKSAEYAKLLSDGWDVIRKSGELKEILDKYGVSDWIQ